MPELIIAEPQAQLALFCAPFFEWLLPDGTVWTRFYRQADGGYLLRFDGLADFFISATANHILCCPIPGVDEATSRHLYLNQVYPLALSKIGKLVFHASAIEINGEVIAFVGRSGRGKSTLAASFCTSGFPMLTDDGLILEEKGGDYYVTPSHPSLRLWDDSMQAIIPEDAALAPSVCYTSKNRVFTGEKIAHAEQASPLRRVYFLGEGLSQDVAISPLSPAEALRGWLSNSFILDVEDKLALASHFERTVALSSVESMYFSLDYPRDYSFLPVLRDILKAHCPASLQRVE